MTEIQGQVAIVTGASRGYGLGIARSLRRAGAEVWITGRDEKTLARAAEKHGLHACQADVTAADDWDRLFDRVLAKHDRLDILVNNAGAGIRVAPLVEQTDDEVLRSIGLNLTGQIFGCRRAAQQMKQQRRGTIVNVASVCARVAWPEWSVYSAAKAGMVQFGKCLYAELREHGVRVTTVMPSWGATDFLAVAELGGHDAETAARCIQPDDMGAMIVQICELPSHLAIQDVTLWPLVQTLDSL